MVHVLTSEFAFTSLGALHWLIAKPNIPWLKIYRHFPNKSELVAEVFRYATEREVAAVAQACDGGETAADKLTAAVETFAQRALLGRRLAYALIAEPVDPRVEQERFALQLS